MVEYRGHSKRSQEGLTAFGTPFIAAMVDVNCALLEQAVNANKEWTGFLNRRLNEGLTTSQALMSADSARSMVDIWSRYMQTMSEDYRDQFSSLIRGNEMLTEKVANAVNSHAREDEEVSRR